MYIYKVMKTYKYTEYVEVEANNADEAEDIAASTDGENNNDDFLYDCKAISKTEIS